MARFYGKVGYAETVETAPGVFKEQMVTRMYYGDVTRIARHWRDSDNLNGNLSVNNSISIVADAYAYQHFSAIRYVEWMDQKWKVSAVEVERPRLILTLGEVYNASLPEV